MAFNLHTARRSAYLAACETNGAGVREGVERDQVTGAGITADYPLNVFDRTMLKAFEHRQGLEIEVATLAKALVVEDAPWSNGLTFSADVFFPTDDPTAPQWVGWIEGEAIEAGPVDDNNFALIIATVDDGEKVVYGYDTVAQWYVPVDTVAFTAFATNPRSREKKS